jgi:polyphosphate kinase
MNSLVDPELIAELYAAGRAGVSIALIVRGICCLQLGLPDVSENIRVISIIDRYLEHARVYYFENAGDPEYLLSSADWMPRNLDKRGELAFPVLEPVLKAQLREILEVQLADTERARELQADGSSRRQRRNGSDARRSQDELYALTGKRATVPAHQPRELQEASEPLFSSALLAE